MNNDDRNISLGGMLMLFALAVPVLRTFLFHSVPWSYAFFPTLVWIVSVVLRGIQKAGNV